MNLEGRTSPHFPTPNNSHTATTAFGVQLSTSSVNTDAYMTVSL